MGPSSPCESTLDCLPRLKIDPLGLAGWLLGQFLQTCLLALLIPRSALHPVLKKSILYPKSC